GGPTALAPRLRQQLCRSRGGRVPTFNYTNAENTVVKGIRAVSSWAIDGGLQGLDKEARRTLGPCQGSAHQWVKLLGGGSKYGASNPVSTHWRGGGSGGHPDRKSTRLNSSHVKISYAVFCLKKKKIDKSITMY